MIELYTQTTPNGRKALIMMEELGVAYTRYMLDFSTAQQKMPDFLAINPNGKIPAIVDPDGPSGTPFSVFESGAILIYLAEKYNSPLWPSDPAARSIVLQWLMFQMGGIGPMFGQAGFFIKFSQEKVPLAIERFTNEVTRLLSVLETRLGPSTYLAGDDYSLADIATWPWVMGLPMYDMSFDGYPNIKRWFDAIGARPAVIAAMAITS